MAETFLFTIATKILGQLGSPALQEIGLLWGVKDELDNLHDTVSTIKAVLLDAQEKQTTNHEVRDWLEKLEDAVYEADDLLDDFSTEALRRKVRTQNKRAKKVRIFFSRSNQLAFRYKMGHKIKAIREKLDAIAANRIKFHLREQQEEMRVENKTRETHSSVRMEEVVGRDKDKNAILKLVLNPDIVQEDVSIIPIVGIGGLGKTTLAQLLYNDEEVKNHFELRMWVCVSDVFDVKLISQNIIESATKVKCYSHQMDGVKEELKKAIDGKKYFLVLDDVWNEDHSKWLKLKELLMGGANGSKILVTTRTQVVARTTSPVPAYVLKGLSEGESWSLFKKIALKQGLEHENPTPVGLGEEIVKKCAGVPLAIRTIGSLLCTKDKESEWSKFKNKELPKIEQTENDILPILKLSYDDLPPHLKRCFAYCAVLPKNHKIDKKTLIQLWMAQGFTRSSDEREHPEDVGNQYFLELFSRSFFQDIEEDGEGNVISCKMHDLIHDLAKFVAGGESCAFGLDGRDFGRRTRHLSFSTHLDLAWENPTFFEANKLRTFLLTTQPRRWGFKKEFKHKNWSNKTIATFKRLRVLDLHWLGIKRVPSSIGQLRHLTYVDLSHNYFLSLPESICELQNLQTLKLNYCDKLKQLPIGTKNLVSLRNLEIEGCNNLSHMPRGLAKLTSLQTLSVFVVGQEDKLGVLSELEGLVNLRGSLWIDGLRGTIGEAMDKNHYYLVGAEFLEQLSLSWDIDRPDAVSDDDGSLFESLRPHRNLKRMSMHSYVGMGFPSWMMVDIGLSLPNIVRISLWNCHRCQYLPPFGLLPSLQFLKLSGMDLLEYVYEEEDCDNHGNYDAASSSEAWGLFPSLKVLHLVDLKRLKGLGSRKGRKVVTTATTSSSSAAEELLLTSPVGEALRHLTALESLYVQDCPQLDLFTEDENGVGMQFQGLRSLTSLSINAMPQLVSLPTWLQSVTTLQSLQVDHCEDLMSLPEWIGNLGSLQKLEIKHCGSLTSLPKGVGRLTALQELIVAGCSHVLKNRCLKKTGEDWPDIAHIPRITIY